MDINEIISKPSAYYDKPKDILSANTLNREQKLKSLKNWEQYCNHLQNSTAEGMTGKDQGEILRLISEALRKIEQDEPQS